MKTAVATLALLASLTTAQYDFSIPSPDVPDLDSRLDVDWGSSQEFKWTLNSSASYVIDRDDQISLWLTSFNNDNFTRLFAPSLDSSNGGSWRWNVDLTDDELALAEGVFTYRLKPPVGSTTSRYDPEADNSSSRGFRIVKDDSSSVTSSATKTTGTIATATGTAASLASASSGTAQGKKGKGKGGGLSTGATAGIGVGVGLLVIAAVAGLLFFLRRRKQRYDSVSTENMRDMAEGHYAEAIKPTSHYEYRAQEQKGASAYHYQPATMEDGTPAELDTLNAPAELPGGHGR